MRSEADELTVSSGICINMLCRQLAWGVLELARDFSNIAMISLGMQIS